mgnify:CR=1 FL=1
MKIAITASGDSGFEAEVDSHFGRAQYFGIIDTETREIKFITNFARGETGGAGVKAAQVVADQKVDVLITGNLGPKAFSALQTTDINLYKFANGTIKKAVDDFNQGNLSQFSAPTNDAHSGLR